MTLLLNVEDKKVIKFKLEKELKNLNIQKLRIEKLIKNNETIIEGYKVKSKELEDEIKNLEFLIEKIK
jgi:fructose-bisphosphate aldolase class 1